MDKRIVITGVGVISSIGIGKDKFWENLLKGKSGISKVELFDTANYQSHNGCEIKGFEGKDFISLRTLVFLGRASQLAVAATKLAIEDAGLECKQFSRSQVSVCMGTTMGESQSIESLNKSFVKEEFYERLDKSLVFQSSVNNIPVDIAMEFKLTGRNRIFTTACAAGNYAISYGIDLLIMGECDYVVAGGSDSF